MHNRDTTLLRQQIPNLRKYFGKFTPFRFVFDVGVNFHCWDTRHDLCRHFSNFMTARKRSLGQGYMFTGVCLSTGRGCLVRAEGGAWSRGDAWSRGGAGPREGGAWSWGGGAWSGGVWYGGCLVETPQTATAVGSTHPTGMHSCFLSYFYFRYI